MANKLFVASLPFSVDDAELEAIFKETGNVTSAKVIVDRDTNRSKGFGFVEMSSDEEAAEAIKQLDGKEVSGRTLVVREARPQEKRERPSYNQGDNRRSW
jgi:RNA recognition motif-containing protein